jgi:hypothetical protein
MKIVEHKRGLRPTQSQALDLAVQGELAQFLHTHELLNLK